MRAALVGVSIAILSLGVAAFTSGTAATVQHDGPVYDGRWWLGRGRFEQLEFLFGYFDCVDESDPTTRWVPVSFDALVDSVSRRYSSHTSAPSVRVGDIVMQWSRKPASMPGGGGEHAQSSYDGNDGMRWKNIGQSYGDSAQLGFVEGYLDCARHRTKGAAAAYPRSAKWYVERISAWYRYDPRTHELDPRRETVPIATVLHRVAQSDSLHQQK